MNLTPTPKSNTEGLKREQKKVLNVPEFKQKMGLYFQNQNLLYILVGPKNDFEPDLKPKNSRKSNSGFNFKFQFQVSILSFKFKFPLQI